MGKSEYEKLATAYQEAMAGHEEPNLIMTTFDGMRLILVGEGWDDAKIERYLTKLREAGKREEGIEPPWEFELDRVRK